MDTVSPELEATSAKPCFIIHDYYGNEPPPGSDWKPSKIHQSESEWIYARNGEFEDHSPDDKGGKWMLFASKANIDTLWDKVITAVKNCDFPLITNVSTVNEAEATHAIMIFTPDYTDVSDVIKVLDYLERSRLNPSNRIIKYKTNKQTKAGIYRKTNAGIYRGRNMRPWLYSSDNIRSLSPEEVLALIETLESDLEYVRKEIEEKEELKRKSSFKYDICKNELVSDCILNPSEIHQSGCEKLYARNNKYTSESSVELSSFEFGQWVLLEAKDRVDDKWNRIKAAVMKGDLWLSEVTQVNSVNPSCTESYVIVIFTKDFDDVKDVIQVLEYLESAGIKSPDTVVKYRMFIQSRPGIYRGSCRKRWIYSSDTIRSLSDEDIEASIMEVISDIKYLSKRRWEEDEEDEKCFFEYDIREDKLISDCILQPSEVHTSEYQWLYANNNKYGDDCSVDFEKIGKWVLLANIDEINCLWNKIKTAVAKGDLWEAKVSTVNNAIHFNTHFITIYTKDYSDQNDVIEVLEYLERTGLKKPGQRIKYIKDGKIRRGISGDYEKSEIYNSASIRMRSGRMDHQRGNQYRQRSVSHGSDSLDWRRN